MSTVVVDKPKLRKVQGVTFVRKESVFKDSHYWEAVIGLYRVEIQKGKHFTNLPLAYVYRLKPSLKAFDPNQPREHQECLLNNLHPQGKVLAEIMEDAVHMVAWHQAVQGPDFDGAVQIPGRDLKPGMKVHHKGVFYEVTQVVLRDPATPALGFNVNFSGRDFGLWFRPDHSATVSRG
jgi:hypothetical protein